MKWILVQRFFLMIAITAFLAAAIETFSDYPIESAIDKQIHAVHEKAARDGWVDERYERN